ncbi:PTS beta-glucoside transporter subunit EIIBCA [Floricoccus penangensis]|uniref:PTS system sucrose-specific EIIBCA component n=1 Tax=Floricoccus penangensis TaxID=1859475 RepID=A0A9Q5NZ51_9LACT|nr:PTS system trehalose-specific EIIBC component [Floricoccus penangensis]OFI46216.1 PTS beta-glucoside transporter subunit EIIBCA [Floricoccus penangensis]
MGKFDQEARDLLVAIGGKENVAAVTHCATRMRFVLNDDSKADVKAIEKIPVVKGTFTNAGQFQVIIGNDVPIFYKDFSQVSGIEGVSKEAAKAQANKKQPIIQRLIATLAEIFTPLLPAIIVGGLILGFRNLLEGVPIEALGQKIIDGVAATNADGSAIYNSITDVSPFWNGVNSFLWLPAEAIFHFLPVGVVWSVVRKFGGTEILGIILGITLVSPQLLNAYAVNAARADGSIKEWVWNFGSFQIEKIGYQAQIIPAIFTGLLFVFLEKQLRKVIPEAIAMIFVPFFSLLPAIIAAHTIIGPIGWKIGQGLSTIVNAGLTSSVNWLFGLVFGALYAPLVITGLHHTLLAIDYQLIADLGYTNLWPMICLSNIAQGAAVAGVILLHKRTMKNRKDDLEREEQISIPSLISAWLGVTEPAMFGINLKYLYPFVAGMIGSGLAGMFSILTGVRANSVGVGGLPGILAIQPKSWMNFFIAMVIAVVVPLFMIFVLRKIPALNKVDGVVEEIDSNIAREEETISTIRQTDVYPQETSLEVKVPLSGKLLPITDTPDPMFAERLIGDGALIDPDEGVLVAPFDGVVQMIFPTNHAIGLISKEGVELLIHIGLDTVKLDGKHFQGFVKEGQEVKTGDELIRFDVKAIKEAGYVTMTPIIVTNQDDFQVDNVKTSGKAILGEELFTATSIK